MNFYSKFSKIDKSHKDNIENTLQNLHQSLKELDLNKLEISDYNKRYLKEHIDEFEKTAWFYSHIFNIVLEQESSLENLQIIDYGGGSGILSYFAKSLGVNTVIYNDIYDVSCNDVSIIAKL